MICNWCRGETEHAPDCQGPRIEFDHNGEPQYWTIRLNKYQRDNLLWLFNAIGYPGGKGVEPFHFANTGDWAGEIPNMLAKPGKNCVLDPEDRPNRSIEDLQKSVEHWAVFAGVHFS